MEQWLIDRGVSVIGSLPEDPAIFEACLEGRKLGTSRAAEAVSPILDRLLSHKA
jgi:CO dehydrogenase nickel-insertion accessory protein CooC1